MKPKSIKNIRQEFKKHGIFYTPPGLAEKLRSYVDIEPESVYDPTCGVGNLLKVFPESVKKYGQELDAEQLTLIDIPNFTGFAGDTLADDKFKDMCFDCIVANPPFSVKWEPDVLANDVRFKNCPALPPPSKADWAFMLHILHHLSDNGVAVILESIGMLFRGHQERKVRQWFVENNYIDRIVSIPGGSFEDTAVRTCLIILKKKRAAADIIFEDGESLQKVSLQAIGKNNFDLNPDRYLGNNKTPGKEDGADISGLIRDMVSDLLVQTDATFALTMQLSPLLDVNHTGRLSSGLKEILDKYGDGDDGSEPV